MNIDPANMDSSCHHGIGKLITEHTFSRKRFVQGVPDAHDIFLVIGKQTFALNGYQDTKEDADWMRKMIALALQSLLESYHAINIELQSAAGDLTEWLRSKAGNNADWPVSIRADNTEDAEVLAKMLERLGKAEHPPSPAK